MRSSRRLSRRGVLLAVVVLAASCGGERGDERLTTRRHRPTAFAVDPPQGPQTGLSEPTEFDGLRPGEVSTAGSVVLMGGEREVKGGLVGNRTAVRWDRSARSWTTLPDLPTNFVVTRGVSVKDVPYGVATNCETQPYGDPSEDCSGVRLVRLVDDGKRWEVIPAPTDDKLLMQYVNSAGVLDGRYVALSASGGRRVAVLYDTEAGTWSSVEPPPDVKENFIADMCYTADQMYLAVDRATENSPGPFTATSEPKTATKDLRVWSYRSGSWSQPLELHTTPTDEPGYALLCDEGRLTDVHGATATILSSDEKDFRSSDVEVNLDPQGWNPIRSQNGPPRLVLIADALVGAGPGPSALRSTPAPIVDIPKDFTIQFGETSAHSFDVLLKSASGVATVRLLLVGRS